MTVKPEITKLPKWAQEYIRVIEREREEAVRVLNKFKDAQTPTNFWTDRIACTGEQSGPSDKRQYIQTNQVTIQIGKAEIDILYRKDENCIDISSGFGTMRVMPRASNLIRIEEPHR
jgi:hypothetical protein